MRFRPCIDLHEGRVKQIVGSSLKQNADGRDTAETRFEGKQSAGYYADLYRRDGLAGGHVIMLGPGNEAAAREALDAYPGGLQIGGGIDADNAESWLAAGAEKVIVTSYVIGRDSIRWANLNHLCNRIGRENIVIDLSCRRTDGEYYVAAQRWQKATETRISRNTLRTLADYCAEFLIHAIDVEGKGQGFDEHLVEYLAEVSPLPTTYAGGVSSMDDVYRIEATGQGKLDVTVGSALDLFGGPVPYAELVTFDRARRP